jgi:UDP-glucose 4-epimerase
MLTDKRIVITGGTGSMGKVLVRRILGGEVGRPQKLIVFSRDEAKQHAMRQAYLHQAATDDAIYRDYEQVLEFRIGDVRSYADVSTVLRNADIVVNAAALKQVPTCEYFPFQAIQTNCAGPENIVRAIAEHSLPIETVIGISTDKACKPVNAMGMSKALQERIFVSGNLRAPRTRFILVRYGNVLASRGSVIPLFLDQIRAGGPLTITSPEMTRFLLSLDQAVDTVFAALREGLPGETYIPIIPSARVTDVARALIGKRPVQTKVTGIRPGEKLDEILVSDEERHHCVKRPSGYYSILPMLPDLRQKNQPNALKKEYSSSDDLMTFEQTEALLKKNRLMPDDAAPPVDDELLR